LRKGISCVEESGTKFEVQAQESAANFEVYLLHELKQEREREKLLAISHPRPCGAVINQDNDRWEHL
jgi:hypothetical protein